MDLSDLLESFMLTPDGLVSEGGSGNVNINRVTSGGSGPSSSVSPKSAGFHASKQPFRGQGVCF